MLPAQTATSTPSILAGKALVALLIVSPAFALSGDDECPSNKTKKKQGAKVALVSAESYEAAKVVELFEIATASRPAAKSGVGTCCDAGECGKVCSKMWKTGQKLADYAAKQPAVWDTIEPLAIARFECETSCKTSKARVVDFLTMNPCESSARIAQKLMKVDAAPVSINHRMAFAQNGCATFSKMLSKQIATSKGGAADLVLPAAMLAFEGRDVGQKLLLDTIEQPYERSGDLTRQFLSRAALNKLKASKCCPKDLHGKSVARALAALDEGDVQLARELAVEARFIADAFMNKKAKKKLSFAHIDGKLASAQRNAAAKLTSADQVFGLIESLQRGEG